jgi:hypothetical protein
LVVVAVVGWCCVVQNIVASMAKTPFGTRSFLNMSNPSQVQTFATFLYKHADDRTRIRALLYHVYYLAIHNRYVCVYPATHLLCAVLRCAACIMQEHKTLLKKHFTPTAPWGFSYA